MAVVGIPVSHEDEALRAARAAAEMRRAIGEHGLEARIGINTGGVVVGGQGEAARQARNVSAWSFSIARQRAVVVPNGSSVIRSPDTRMALGPVTLARPPSAVTMTGASARECHPSYPSAVLR